MSETTPTIRLLDDALDALRQMLVAGIRNSAPLVHRCGELSEQLRAAGLRPVAEQLRGVVDAGDDGARIAAVCRSLLVVKQARLRLSRPTKAHAPPEP